MGMKPTKTEALISECSARPLNPSEKRTVDEISRQYWNLDKNLSKAEIKFLREIKKKNK